MPADHGRGPECQGESKSVEVLAGIAPTKEGACGEEDCSEWDGKRCRITGCQPHGRCEPGWERLVSALDAKAKGGAR